MNAEHLTLLVVGGPIALAAASLHARVFPLRVCPRCRGGGELASGRNRRPCPRCGGTKRIRRILAPRA